MTKTLHESAVELLDALQLIKGTPMKYDGLHIIEDALKDYAESEVKKISLNLPVSGQLPLSEVNDMMLWISKMFDLIEGIWYWKGDTDGENPLNEQELIEAWRKR